MFIWELKKENPKLTLNIMLGLNIKKLVTSSVHQLLEVEYTSIIKIQDIFHFIIILTSIFVTSHMCQVGGHHLYNRIHLLSLANCFCSNAKES